MTKNIKIKFSNVYLNLVSAYTIAGIQHLEHYVNEIEQKFEADLQKIEYPDISEIKLFEDEVIEDYFPDEFKVIENVFKYRFRYSIITSLYTLLEVSINQLCDHLKKYEKLPISYRELRGDGIQRAKNYLCKMCAITEPFNRKEWADIQTLNLLRNCIVHADGNIEQTKSPDKLKNRIKVTNHISGNSELHIDKEYLLFIINSSIEFLEQIYSEAKKL